MLVFPLQVIIMKILRYYNLHNITGKQIKVRRNALGLTQEQVAAQMQTAGIQINQKAISRIESGDRIITDYELLRLSEILDTSAAKLMEEAYAFLSETESDS